MSENKQKMNLSEAIREGAKIRRRCRHGYFCRGGSCAMGAAWEAVGGCEDDITFSNLSDEFPDLFRLRKITAPVGGEFRNLHGAISHLNDKANWARERIADWVEEVENTNTD